MKELFNFNVKHGGLTGRKMRHQMTIKKMALGIMFMIAALFTVSIVDAQIKDVNMEKVGAVTGLGLATVLPVFMIDGKFKELTGADWDTFKEKASAEELAQYFNAKNEAKRKELQALIDGKASKEDIENLRNDLKESQVEQMKHLNEAIKQMGIQIKKLSEKEKEQGLGIQSSIRKGLEAHKENLKNLKGKVTGAHTHAFAFKAAGTMLISSNVSGGNVPVEQRIPGLDTLASRRVRLLDLFSRGTATSNIISWVSQANKDGAAGGTSEGATKNQIDFDLVVANEDVCKRTAFIKVSDEMIDDIDFIEAEINNELMRELLKDVESTAYSGNGTAPNLNGIRTVSTAFAAGTFAGTVENANEVDVLVVAVNQILIAEQPQPNAILMHPSDITKLKLEKVSSTDKRYIERLQMIGGSLSMDGIPMIPTTLVTAGTYLVGSFDLATLYTKDEVSIEVGLDGNDFTKNLRTIRAEWRGALVTKTNVRTAFVKGTFSTDKSALETT